MIHPHVAEYLRNLQLGSDQNPFDAMTLQFTKATCENHYVAAEKMLIDYFAKFYVDMMDEQVKGIKVSKNTEPLVALGQEWTVVLQRKNPLRSV